MSDSSLNVRTTRPALDVLDRDQDAVLYEGDDSRTPPIRPLTAGFTSYWQLLCWYQATAVRTLGHVRGVLSPDAIGPAGGISNQLLVVESADDGAYVRQRLVERLDDACDLAYRQFRERAVERAGEAVDDGTPDYGQIDPKREENPLMRPAFRLLDREQAAALHDLWTGFENRQAVSRWARELTSPTNGELPEGFVADIIRTPALLDALTDRQRTTATLQRYQFACHAVLPAMCTAAATLRGGERHDAESDKGGWKKA
jgi:hypothetical protein